MFDSKNEEIMSVVFSCEKACLPYKILVNEPYKRESIGALVMVSY